MKRISCFSADPFDLLQGGESAAASNSEPHSGEDPADKPDIPRAVKNWPNEDLKLGQVSAVAVNSALQPVIFHRANRSWDRL